MTHAAEPLPVPPPHPEPRPVGPPAPRAMSADELRSKQRALMRSYRHEPDAAWTSDGARTEATGDFASDPVYTSVKVGREHDIHVPVGVHRKIGGPQDLPVPGDILAAALASCADQTLRIVANQLRVRLTRLSVSVVAELDVRGTLLVDADVPVGFQKLRIDVDLAAAPGTDPDRVQRVLMAAEHCCVVLQTLRKGVPVAFEVSRSGDGA